MTMRISQIGLSKRVAISSPKTTLLAVVMLIAASCAALPTSVAVTGDLADFNRAPVCQVAEPVTDEASHDDEVAHDDEASHDDEVAHDDEVVDDAATIEFEDVELTIDIEMSEFAYDCELPDIPVDTVVALRFINVGTIEHEAVVGDHTAQSNAAQEMAEMQIDDQMHGHGAPAITLQPDESVELIVMFDEPGEQIIGCHIPGHWDEGMNTYFLVTDA